MRVTGSLMPCAFAAAALMVSGGCEPSTRTTSGPNAAAGERSAENGASWPFWPAKMRIHPLTRVVPAAGAGRVVIEARLEFVDADNVTTRASGQLTLRLYADAQQPDGAEAIGTWNQDLRDVAVNRRQYDDVTRTYLFRMEVDAASLPEKPELRAFFLSATGREMSGRFTINR